MIDRYSWVMKQALLSGATISRWLMCDTAWRAAAFDSGNFFLRDDPRVKKQKELFGIPVVIDPDQDPQLIVLRGANEVSLKVPL